MKTNWSDIKESKPFFWVMLRAWLKSKNAVPTIEKDGYEHNEYVKLNYDDTNFTENLSAEMLIDFFDEIGIRLCVDFDKESKESLWNCRIFKNKPFTDFWYQTYCFDGVLPNRKSAILNGLRYCIEEVNYSLEIESKEANFM
jgi:hypothetical protein